METNRVNLNISIIFRLLLIVATSIAGAWFLVLMKNIGAALVFFMLIIIQTVLFINKLNELNRKVSFFFDAVENDDSTLYYPERVQNKAIRRLNISLNHVNKKIQKVKRDNIEKEQYFAAILEQVSSGILVVDEKENVLQANTAAKRLLQLEQFTHLVQLKRVEEGLYITFQQLKSGDKKLYKVPVKKSHVELSIQSEVFKTTTQTLRLISIQDIHSELDEKEAESWIRLIRVLTHEIMNSIAPITSLSETLMGILTKEGEVLKVEDLNTEKIQNTVDGLEVIGERGKELISFVESYRKLTRIPTPNMQPIHVGNLVDKLRILVSTEPGFENTTFEVNIQPEDLEIMCDENQIRHVMINLVKNALEALNNKEDGKIGISAQVGTNGKPTIRISDNGPGIPTDLIDQIFIPFFTTKEGGSGIGLSFSRQVMRLHGGTLRVQSNDKTGSEFRLMF